MGGWREYRWNGKNIDGWMFECTVNNDVFIIKI